MMRGTCSKNKLLNGMGKRKRGAKDGVGTTMATTMTATMGKRRRVPTGPPSPPAKPRTKANMCAAKNNGGGALATANGGGGWHLTYHVNNERTSSTNESLQGDPSLPEACKSQEVQGRWNHPNGFIED